MTELIAEAPERIVPHYQLEPGLGRLTPAERAARGKSARAEVLRDSHAAFDPAPHRPDPVAPLAAAAAYADQNEHDHPSLLDGVTSGRIAAERGV